MNVRVNRVNSSLLSVLVVDSSCRPMPHRSFSFLSKDMSDRILDKRKVVFLATMLEALVHDITTLRQSSTVLFVLDPTQRQPQCFP